MPENVATVLLRYSDFQTGVTVFVPACALPKCVRKTFSSVIRMDSVLNGVWELPEKFCIQRPAEPLTGSRMQCFISPLGQGCVTVSWEVT